MNVLDDSLYFLKLTQNGDGIPKLEQSLTIHDNLSWNICIYDKKLSPSDEVSPLPSTLPETITFMTDLKQVIDFVDACSKLHGCYWYVYNYIMTLSIANYICSHNQHNACTHRN